MNNKKPRIGADRGIGLDMTPMIDVVFQLLIFFLVSLKPIEIIGRLDVFRPQAGPVEQQVPRIDVLRITVHENHRFMLNRRQMTLVDIERNLVEAARRDPRQTVLVECSERSGHHSLVAVLDLCAKTRLTNLSVVTLSPSALSI